MLDAALGILLANVAILLANLVILAIVVKLYTEYFKDRSRNLTHEYRKGGPDA